MLSVTERDALAARPTFDESRARDLRWRAAEQSVEFEVEWTEGVDGEGDGTPSIE